MVAAALVGILKAAGGKLLVAECSAQLSAKLPGASTAVERAGGFRELCIRSSTHAGPQVNICRIILSIMFTVSVTVLPHTPIHLFILSVRVSECQSVRMSEIRFRLPLVQPMSLLRSFSHSTQIDTGG